MRNNVASNCLNLIAFHTFLAPVGSRFVDGMDASLFCVILGYKRSELE